MTLDESDTAAGTDELDVRQIPKPQRHPMIFARFDALAVGESFVLINSHDPIHLREEFAHDRQGVYDWRYLESSRAERLWRIRIARVADGSGVTGDQVGWSAAGGEDLNLTERHGPRPLPGPGGATGHVRSQ